MLPMRTQLRRTFLRQTGVSLSAAALGTMLPESAPAQSQARRGLPHHPPKVKRVIFLYMAGGPSQIELFDNKPRLAQLDGRPMPTSYTRNQPIAQLQNQRLLCMGPQFRFRKHGKSGQEISELLPHISRLADDLCIIRSMHTDQINHDPAHTVMNTGTAISGRPSLGAWVTYGLGTESQNLPGFVVMTSTGGRNPQPISYRQWAAGFLPAEYQGIEFSSLGDPVHYLNSPPGMPRDRQRESVDAIAQLDQIRQGEVANSEISARIRQYEMAFRMQMSVPELMDFRNEPQHVKEMYGTQGADGTFAANCLLARRLAERGVRFIQLYHRGWDHHDGIHTFLRTCCRLTDQPTWALMTDLKQRGLWDDTLIVWGGEFGRTPMVQYKSANALPGRDHHMRGFTMFLGGGAVRGGMTYGSTDELGYFAAENKVHVHDLHATMLHLLGIDHLRFSHRFQGLDFRLTGVEEANIVREILA